MCIYDCWIQVPAAKQLFPLLLLPWHAALYNNRGTGIMQQRWPAQQGGLMSRPPVQNRLGIAVQPAGKNGTQPAVCVRVENTDLYQLYIRGNRNKQDYIWASVRTLLIRNIKVLKRCWWGCSVMPYMQSFIWPSEGSITGGFRVGHSPWNYTNKNVLMSYKRFDVTC